MNGGLSPKPLPVRLPDQREAIRRRAEEIYVRSGRIAGRDLDNWAQAEQEILRELAERPNHKKAIVVRVNGIEYTGEYDLESSEGYLPGELGSGANVTVRFQGDKMVVQRANGKELETTIVKKVDIYGSGDKKTG